MNKLLTLTERAQTYLAKQLASDKTYIGVLIALEKAGCAGYMYQIRLIKEVPEKYQLQHIGNIAIYIPDSTIPRIVGSKLDYVRQGIETKAVFDNPNVTLACGCGDSVELLNKEESANVS